MSIINLREGNKTALKTELCKVEVFDRKVLLKVNNQNLRMKCKIGNVGNELNLTAIKLANIDAIVPQLVK